MNENQSLLDLITDATQLLLDHNKCIQDLIYWACTLDSEARTAMIIAYNNLNTKFE